MFFKKDKTKDAIRVIPLGGQDGVGMNCWIYEHGKTRIMVDCGVSVGDDSTADQILPDISYLKDKKVDAVLLTHWHVDHINALPFFYEELGRPMVYSTPLTLAKLQRTINEDMPKVGKLKSKVIPAAGKRVKIGDFEAEFIHSTHHTPQSVMIALRCKTGALLHTGDWALNPKPNIEEPTDEKALKNLNKDNFLAVIGDSTEIYRKEVTHGEETVSKNVLKYFKKAEKKIIVPLFSSTIGRLKTIYDNAQKVGREVCLLGRSVETNAELAQEHGFLKECNFITLDQARGLGDDQIVYISTGCQGEPMAALPRILKRQYRGLSLNKGDMVLFSSSVIPGNEKDILEMYNKVVEQGATLVTMSDDIVHSHGHGGLQEFIRFYGELVKPKYLIPTHGDAMSKFQHGELAKKYGVKDALHIRNGDVVEFTTDGAPAIIEKVDAGAIAVEGPFRISLKDPIFKNRSKVYYEGAVIVSIPLNKKGVFTGVPVVSSLGFFETTGGEFIQKEVVLAITKGIKDLPVKDAKNRTTLHQTINTAVRKTVKPYFSRWKRPKIVTHFVEV